MAKAKAKKKVVKKTAPVKKKAVVKKVAVKKSVAKKVVAKKAVAKKIPAKKPASTKAKTVINKKSLEVAIDEMNAVGDWEPALKKGSEEEMRKTIESELSEVLDDDPFTKETWDVIKELGFGSTEKAKKKEVKKKTAESKKKINVKSPSIINTLIGIIKKDGPITREGIYNKLVKAFPDRDPSVLQSRVKCQVPGRLNIERKLGIIEDEKGRYSIKK